MGDFGCELPEDEKVKLMGVDVMMMPVGGHYTLDPKKVRAVVDEIKPTVLIPMHYRFDDKGYEVIESVEAYELLCDDVIIHDDNELHLPEDLYRQTAVLTYIDR